MNKEHIKRCPVCNKYFNAITNQQIYCCSHCRKIHHKKVYYDKNRLIPNYEIGAPIIRQFVCKKCHKLVSVSDKKDRRTKFCCPQHEKLYYKHSNKQRKIDTFLTPPIK